MKEKEFLILQKPNSTGILLEGAAKRLTIKKDDPDFHLAWTRINNFINKNKGHYIYGYLGFDLHAINQPNLKLSTQPAAEFFVAKTKQDFTNPKEVISGNFRGCKKLNLKKYLDNDKEHFIKHTKDTIDWVQKVQGRKLTIARNFRFNTGAKPGFYGRRGRTRNTRFRPDAAFRPNDCDKVGADRFAAVGSAKFAGGNSRHD